MISSLRGTGRRADARRRRPGRERRWLPRPDERCARSARHRRSGEVTLDTYLHVREDALQLYGFAEPAERELFEHFLSVSGVGPKVALAILSGSTPADIRRAIALEDTTRFVAIPGIGKKTAERVVRAEGEDRHALEVVDAPREQELVARDALMELGYSIVEAERALASTDPDAEPEERARQALRAA